MKVLPLVATEPLKNRESLTGLIRGWNQTLNATSTHHGDRATTHL
ncbi:MAG: hypothetical protein AAF937_12720 [Planctomycetota bacterium]